MFKRQARPDEKSANPVPARVRSSGSYWSPMGRGETGAGANMTATTRKGRGSMPRMRAEAMAMGVTDGQRHCC